jgi:UDP:flavonoid glycosyltransferase YjiC (YdhE family)
LEQLTKAGLKGEVYLRSAVPAVQARLQASGLIVHRRPPAMSDVLDRVSLILHHASLGTAEAALAAGCPQLVYPRHLEQRLTADALVALGVGKYLTGKISMSEIIQTARELCDPRYADQAQTVAMSLQQRPATNPLQQILACCADLL